MARPYHDHLHKDYNQRGGFSGQGGPSQRGFGVQHGRGGQSVIYNFNFVSLFCFVEYLFVFFLKFSVILIDSDFC